VVATTRVNRQVTVMRESLIEAVSETRGASTEIGFEAVGIRASGPLTAKLSRQGRTLVDPALVPRQSMALSGEILNHA